VNHIVELWEMVEDGRAVCVPACLLCGWTGEKGTRLKAEREGRAHEEGRISVPIALDPAAPDVQPRGNREAKP
jgi:hypothetical protein